MIDHVSSHLFHYSGKNEMSDLMSRAVDLVLYGMGTVFIFLTVLVGVTMLMSYLVQKGLGPVEPVIADSIDPLILAAITAAVKQFRQDRL